MKYIAALLALCTFFEVAYARDECRCTIEQRVWIRVDNTDPNSRPILYTAPPGVSGKHTDYQVVIKRRATDREPLPTGNYVVPWNLWPTSDTE